MTAFPDAPLPQQEDADVADVAETPSAGEASPAVKTPRRRRVPATAAPAGEAAVDAAGSADAAAGGPVDVTPRKAPRRRAAVPAVVDDGASAPPAGEPMRPAADAEAVGTTDAGAASMPAPAAEAVPPAAVAGAGESSAGMPAAAEAPADAALPSAAIGDAPDDAAARRGRAAPAGMPSSSADAAEAGHDGRDGEPEDAGQGDAGRGEGVRGAGGDERSGQRNRRERQRARRAAPNAADGAGSDAAVPAGAGRADDPATAAGADPGLAVALFADVMSGEFDLASTAAPAADADATTLPATTAAPADDAVGDDSDSEGDEESVDAGGVTDAPGKRVLAPDPDAPKLQKVLAQAGVGSRRDMEDLIQQGAITVNGERAHIGQRISFRDRIAVNGKPIKFRIAPPTPRVVAYHKPAGEVVTHDDPQQRPTVFRRLPRLPHGKWLSVGRLDINTEGLLLFTNSGELANQLMHPRFGVEREYAVRVLGVLDKEGRERLIAGVSIDGQTAAFKSIEEGGGDGANRWYRVVITEGRNREVRKLFDTVGLTVSRLIRIRYGTVVLPRGLKRGVWIDLAPDDVRRIRQLAAPDRQRGDGRPQQQPVRAGHADGGEQPERGGRNGIRPDDRGPRPGAGQPGQRDPAGRSQPSRRDRDRGPADGVPRNMTAAVEPARERRDDDEDLDFDPSRIPNPLEQTFDRRFANNPRSPVGGHNFARGGGGFGGGGSAPPPRHNTGGPKEPDPLQTSIGYIGADAYHRRAERGPFRGGSSGGGQGGFGGGGAGGSGGGKGPNRGGFSGGGKGPNRGGHGGNRGR